MRHWPAAYRHLLLTRPRTALAILSVMLCFFAYHTRDFRVDASVDSLVLEDDRDLQLFREVSARYRTRASLIVTFSPLEDLFSTESLSHITRLREELRPLQTVDSVMTILDVPLVKSSDVPLAQMATNVQTLETPTIDRQRAREELLTSPFYKDLVVSRDGQTTALLINLKEDPELTRWVSERNQLLIKRGAVGLTRAERRDLREISAAYDAARASVDERRHEDIQRIRAIIARYEPYAVLHLGGIPMIADDMVAFVKNDLIIFGSGVFAFLVIILSLIFRESRWVILPLLSCIYAGLTMIGLLGLIGWKVTVMSSNFLSLMLIITISMNIHLAVRYRQLLRDQPDESQLSLVSATMGKMVWPCLYTSLTTIIGFSSLVFSDIKPVVDFGWMMCAGLAVVFLTSFSLFPAILVLLKKSEPAAAGLGRYQLTSWLARVAERNRIAIPVSAVVLLVTSVVGISRLTVENSFISYFKQDTEIYQGLKLIDEKLGGTTSLEVLLNLDPSRFLAEAEEPLDDEFDIDVASGPEYWFTPLKIDKIKSVHDYLDGLPEVGKVLSLASVVRVAEELNDGEELDSLELSLLYRRLPDEVKEPMVDPYFSYGHDEARILLRILDSKEDLRRGEFLEKVRSGLSDELELSDRDVTVTGTLVLYNNMLQSLFTSQISSLGAVMAGIAVMLLILFRSVSLSIIGILPNVLAAATVLGLIGLVGIPLDMMTITIAAITIGIAVDNAIHYIYRFREEFALNGDYVRTLYICHANIGRAVLYTSTTIIFGFSILVLSNFFPTIYFGALTGLAMLIALLAALTLLPRLILLFRPFGRATR